MPVPARLLLCVTLLLGHVSTTSAQSEASGSGAPRTEGGDAEPATVEAQSDVIPELDPAPERVDGLDGFQAPTPVPPAPIESTETWALGGGSGDAIAWQPVSPTLLPTGPIIGGLQLRVGGAFLGLNVTEGPTAELAGVFDVRYGGGPFHLRVALAFEYVHSETQAAFFRSGTTNPSPFGIKARILPIALDLGPFFAMRLGGDLGVWIVDAEGFAESSFLYGVLGEMALRVRQLEGLLEVGVYGGFHWRAARISGPVPTTNSGHIQVLLGLQAMWTFQ